MSRKRFVWPPYPTTSMERLAIVLAPELVLIAGLLTAEVWSVAAGMTAVALVLHFGAVTRLRPSKLEIIRRTRAELHDRTIGSAARFLIWATDSPRSDVVKAVQRSQLARAVSGVFNESWSFELGAHTWRFVDVGQTRWTLEWMTENGWTRVSTAQTSGRLPRTWTA
ncbi:hypothetical protein F8O06_04895 [Pseudoclavibacter sp. CFCC 14310]|uniref:hypothetical protein n=1 Tax=Pseudoclavibacter sp. CFCC 14310 TaxID=2615180 RepID=UPI0013010068|nr:hypothetical protein [Pseudoclavibacter sp. CFCC 14310]KAB1645438.1 hypothetical protein F8O06_07550 [Pseudoclavibacter sp. CFCC 14310]KAB1646103.1 hypothetical protein F8O06_04895 [Pseudoclavibacter sp. CFCC 14310]